MKKVVHRGWVKKAQAGVVSAEIAAFTALLATGAGVGWTSMRDAQIAEADDIAEAVGSLDQGYYYSGLRAGHGSAAVAGSHYRDTVDVAAGDGQRFQFSPSAGREGQGRP